MIRIGVDSNKTKVRLVGGLGNQLFIYFAGLYLSEKLKSKLVCDLSHLDLDRTKHGVSITSFDLEGEFVRKSRYAAGALRTLERFASYSSHKSSWFKRFYQKTTKFYLPTGIGYDPELENICADVILRGYFQTWKYVRALQVGKEFALKVRNPSPWFAQKKLMAEETRPIIIHVRQGDYRDDVNSFIGVLGPDYYKKALLEIRNTNIKGPVWVFSDEVESAKRILGLDFADDIEWIVAPKGIDPAEELAIMQFGGAHIIANSTFSWWGAYFSQSTKLVIAPKTWFKGRSEPLNLIPPDWKRIENDWL